MPSWSCVPTGPKEYLRTTAQDEAAYAAAGTRLLELRPPLRRVEIQTEYDTRQVLNDGYSRRDRFFNDRQRLSVALLSRAIGTLPAGAERDALFVLLSRVLEFKNLFASYKARGPGRGGAAHALAPCAQAGAHPHRGQPVGYRQVPGARS
jgi:hypothetical protein